MKKILHTVLIGLLSAASYAQTTEKRPLTDFTSLEVRGEANVTLIQGDSLSLKVEADEKDQKNIITEITGNKLTIKTEGNINGDDIQIVLTYKNIEMLDVSGAAQVNTENTLNGNKLEVITSGASKAVLDIVIKEFKTNTSGASTLVVSGATENHLAESSGASSLKASKLSSINTEINTSGASSAKVNANKKLTANASGASSIKYYGNPSDKNISAGKASSVESHDLADGDIQLNDMDTTRIKFGKKKYIIIDEEGKEDKKSKRLRNLHHWKGIDLGINGYAGADNNVSLPTKDDYMSVDYGVKSMVCNLNLFEKNMHIYKNYINLVTGLGFGFNSYQFKNKTTLNGDSSYTSFTNNPAISYDKNKLKMSYIQMPLMLEFNTSNSRHKTFHLAAGVLAGYKLTSKTKQIYTLNGGNYEVIKKDDYNINPFKLDATVRVGYGDFTLFGTYALTTLFEKNKGPELYPFTVGFRIVPF